MKTKLKDPAPWKSTLKIKDLISGEKDIQEVASALALRIAENFDTIKLSERKKHELFVIMNDLRLLSDIKDLTKSDVNAALNKLYDWADEDKTCWLE